MRIEVRQGTDETGALEEFSWDLFPLVNASETLHLESSGLPKVGTRIEPGMIIVGKIGRSRFYDPERQPAALEIHGLDFETLRSRYGPMWKDTSLYADEATAGVVSDAGFESQDGSTVAVVQIEKEALGGKTRGWQTAAL
jgi:DNA-directed RNA polymerase beta subunit